MGSTPAGPPNASPGPARRATPPQAADAKRPGPGGSARGAKRRQNRVGATRKRPHRAASGERQDAASPTERQDAASTADGRSRRREQVARLATLPRHPLRAADSCAASDSLSAGLGCRAAQVRRLRRNCIHRGSARRVPRAYSPAIARGVPTRRDSQQPCVRVESGVRRQLSHPVASVLVSVFVDCSTHFATSCVLLLLL